MASPAAGATAPVEWVIQTVSVGGLTFSVARLKVRLDLARSASGLPPLALEAWLDTGAPLSVIPFHVQQQGLNRQVIPGIRVSWSGQPCDLGRIDCWLATDEPPGVRGPFSLLAKFPHSDPPGSPVRMLLGLEFLLTNQIELNVPVPPHQGALRLP
jgi:hypothetical protein